MATKLIANNCHIDLYFCNSKKCPKFFRFDSEVGNPNSPQSIFCMPIRDPDDKVLGVISLINKDNDGGFTDNDAR